MTVKIKERISHYLELQPSQFEWPREKRHNCLLKKNGFGLKLPGAQTYRKWEKRMPILKGEKLTEKGVCDYSIIWVRSITSCLLISSIWWSILSGIWPLSCGCTHRKRHRRDMHMRDDVALLSDWPAAALLEFYYYILLECLWAI